MGQDGSLKNIPPALRISTILNSRLTEERFISPGMRRMVQIGEKRDTRYGLPAWMLMVQGGGPFREPWQVLISIRPNYRSTGEKSIMSGKNRMENTVRFGRPWGIRMERGGRPRSGPN